MKYFLTVDKRPSEKAKRDFESELQHLKYEFENNRLTENQYKTKKKAVTDEYYSAECMGEVIWNKGFFDGWKANDLKSIAEFCMSFLDEKDLKEYLHITQTEAFHQGIITRQNKLDNKLKIRYINRGVIHTLSYGIPYMKDRKYFDLQGTLNVNRKNYSRERKYILSGYLRDFLCSRMKNYESADFLYDLANKFELHESLISVNNEMRKTSYMLQNGIPFTIAQEDELKDIMDDFIRYNVFKYDAKIKGNAIDEDNNLIAQYRKLYDLAMYVKNQVEQKSKTNKTEQVQEESPKQLVLQPLEQLSMF